MEQFFGVVVGLFDIFKKKSKRQELLDARQKVTVELKEAEKNFLQHKIDKPTFDSISRERNSELIRIEAEIDLQKHKELPKEDAAIAQKVSLDKRKVILGLLEEKQKKVHELKFAESSYLKRRISEDVYQKISSEIKKEMISIDSQVKAILENDEIARLKSQLKSGGAEIAKQQKLSDSRKMQDFADELEEDIFEQAKDVNLDSSEVSKKKNSESGSRRQGARNSSDYDVVDSANSDSPVANDYSDAKNIPRRLRVRR